MSEKWNDELPDWDEIIDVGNIGVTNVDLLDSAFDGVKNITDVLTELLTEETKAKDLTITKLQYVIDHLLRCLVSLHEGKSGLLIGGCIFLPSKYITETKMRNLDRETTHVDWGEDEEKKHRAITAFFQHMLESSQKEIAKNDRKIETLSERFVSKLEEK